MMELTKACHENTLEKLKLMIAEERRIQDIRVERLEESSLKIEALTNEILRVKEAIHAL